MRIRNLLLGSASLYSMILRAPEDGTGGGAGDQGAQGAAPPPGGGTSLLSNPPANGTQAPPPADKGTGDQGTQGAQTWFDKLTPELKSWAENKGWKADTADPAKLIESQYNLEKLMGHDKAGRTIVLPKDANDKEALDAIYDKLGRPKDPDGYTFEMPAGADPEFAKVAKGWFHGAGLTDSQAKAVTESYRAMELEAVAKVEERHAAELKALREEWGAKAETNTETVKAALKASNLTDAHYQAIETALGPAATARLFEFFGRNYVEAGPPGAQNRTAGTFGNVNPVEAKAKMDALYADKAFMERYQNPDPKIRASAIAEMDALAKAAARAVA